MGTTGRGEHMEVGTYIEHSVDHELSANIIDLCPVGALNNKPFRYHARAWEMQQQALVSPHDAFGTNMYAHVLRGKIMRIVPRENEEINETWIADRDRFGFEGIYSAERVTPPMVRVNGVLEAGGLGSGVDGGGRRSAEGDSRAWRGGAGLPGLAHGDGGGVVSPGAHRARRRQPQHRSSPASAGFPRAGRRRRLSESRSENRRCRKARGRAGRRLESAARNADARASRSQGGGQGRAKVAFLNPRRFDYLFPVAAYGVSEADLVGELAAVVQAAAAAREPAGAGRRRLGGGHRWPSRRRGRAGHRYSPCRHFWATWRSGIRRIRSSSRWRPCSRV